MTSCPSAEHLARIVLGFDIEEELRSHIAECVDCQGVLATMTTLDATLSQVATTLDEGHADGRLRLLTELTTRDRRPSRFKLGELINHWTGGLTVGQRTVIGGAGMAAILAIAFLWAGNSTQTASAMERMAKNLREVKAYQATIDFELQFDRKPGEKVTTTMSQKLYWSAPRSYRMEFEQGVAPNRRQQIEIYPFDQPGIEIDLTQKVFRRKPPRRGKVSPFLVLDHLAQFSGKADRELNPKQIDGRQAEGFEIDAKKIDPDGFAGPVEVWLDTETELPLLVRYAIRGMGTGSAVMTMHGFQWNASLDAKLFDTTPPADFKDATPAAMPLDEQLSKIIESFSVYAELSGGHYPRATVIYGDVVRDEMLRMAGIQGEPTAEDMRGDKFAKIMKAGWGFGLLTGGIFRENADVVYSGRTVGPKDKEKILLHWRLDDGRYQVIYGDLHSAVIPADKLPRS